jgi:large subunit ribosomal protein L32e
MTERKKLLEVRKTIKDKKPEFKQQNFGRKKRISDRWRKPKGHQSKMRHKFKGYNILVSQGWRSPVEIRGTDRFGNETIIIANVQELAKVEKHQAIVISGNVGNKKRMEIILKAEELKIPVVNIKVDKFKAKIAKAKEDKDKEKAAKSEKKKKTIEDSLKKAEKKEKDKSKKSTESVEDTEEKEEEKKAEEKKEREDILIHKE